MFVCPESDLVYVALAMAVMTGASASHNSLTNHVSIGSGSDCLFGVSRIIREISSTVVLMKPGNGERALLLMVGDGEDAVATRLDSTLVVGGGPFLAHFNN